MKKILIVILSFITFHKLFGISIDKLIFCTLENNTDIITADKNYKSAILSYKTLDGVYSPQVSYSTTSNLSNGYEWNSIPEYFSSSMTYKQPLPGGTTLGFKIGFFYNSTEIQKKVYITQSPDICFLLTQSLFPYWVQGRIQNPEKLSIKQQEEYFYYQLVYTKKTVLQNLLQNYIYAAINLCQIEIYEKSIKLIDEQIKAAEQILLDGSGNQAQITQLQSSKWSYQQDLMSSKTNYYDYIQNIKNLSGTDFDEEIFFIEQISQDELVATLDKIFKWQEDPVEMCYKLKIELLNAFHILENQSSAPVMELSLQPSWNLEAYNAENWKKAWTDIGNPKSWTVSIGVNISPLFSGLLEQNKEKYKMDLEQAEYLYDSYLFQKTIVLEKYKTIKEQYEHQLQNISKLYESGLSELQDTEEQFSSGAISKLNFESIQVRNDICKINMKIVELYCYLYNILIFLTN